MRKQSGIILVVLFCSFCAVFLSGCNQISREDYDKVLNDLADAQEALSVVKDDYETITAELEQSKLDFNQLEEDYTELQHQYDTLASEYEEYKTMMSPYESIAVAEATSRDNIVGAGENKLTVSEFADLLSQQLKQVSDSYETLFRMTNGALVYQINYNAEQVATVSFCIDDKDSIGVDDENSIFQVVKMTMMLDSTTEDVECINALIMTCDPALSLEEANQMGLELISQVTDSDNGIYGSGSVVREGVEYSLRVLFGMLLLEIAPAIL